MKGYCNTCKKEAELKNRMQHALGHGKFEWKGTCPTCNTLVIAGTKGPAKPKSKEEKKSTSSSKKSKTK